jgi:hypothetical protein
MATTINDSYQPISGNPVILTLHIGHGQPARTTVLLGTGKVFETLDSDFSVDLTQFKNPINGTVLRVRCNIQDAMLTGKSFVKFTVTDGVTIFDSLLPENEIIPTGGFIVYTYRLLLI